jgi:hypothetical protein
MQNFGVMVDPGRQGKVGNKRFGNKPQKVIYVNSVIFKNGHILLIINY